MLNCLYRCILESWCYISVMVLLFFFFPLPLRVFALSLCIVISGGSFLRSRRAMAKVAQRQHPRLFPPRKLQIGGASPVCRHPLWHKSRKSVARPVLPAMQSGGNFLNSANCNPIRNLSTLYFALCTLLVTHNFLRRTHQPITASVISDTTTPSPKPGGSNQKV